MAQQHQFHHVMEDFGRDILKQDPIEISPDHAFMGIAMVAQQDPAGAGQPVLQGLNVIGGRMHIHDDQVRPFHLGDQRHGFFERVAMADDREAGGVHEAAQAVAEQPSVDDEQDFAGGPRHNPLALGVEQEVRAAEHHGRILAWLSAHILHSFVPVVQS